MRRWTRLEVLELTRRVLEDENRALTEQQIWNVAKSKGYHKGLGRHGARPWISIRNEVNRDIRYNKDTPFRRVGSRPRKISLLSIERVHAYYCRRLVDLGRSLGYDTKIPRTGLFHLACPDSVWYVNTRVGLRKIPVIAFEVLASESEKAIRGSLTSLMLYGSPRGVLVLLTKMYERRMRSKTVKEWKEYIRSLITALGLKGRVLLWDEAKVDRLVRQFAKQNACLRKPADTHQSLQKLR